MLFEGFEEGYGNLGRNTFRKDGTSNSGRIAQFYLKLSF